MTRASLAELIDDIDARVRNAERQGHDKAMAGMKHGLPTQQAQTATEFAESAALDRMIGKYTNHERRLQTLEKAVDLLDDRIAVGLKTQGQRIDNLRALFEASMELLKKHEAELALSRACVSGNQKARDQLSERSYLEAFAVGQQEAMAHAKRDALMQLRNQPGVSLDEGWMPAPANVGKAAWGQQGKLRPLAGVSLDADNETPPGVDSSRQPGG